MRLNGRRKRLDHARFVGLRSVPERAPRRRPAKRVAALAGAVAVIVLGGVAVAGTLAGGSPKPASAADGVSPTAAALGSVPSDATPRLPASANPSAGPGATPSELPVALLEGYRWPLDHGRITTAFTAVPGGLFIVDGRPFHDGVDIATFCGDHILAAHDGVVIATGRHVEGALGWVGDVAAYEARLTSKGLWGGHAIMVITDDGNGYRSVYVHLYRSLVKVGQRLAAGDLVGYEGRTGDATGCHLHYSIFSPSDPGRFITDPARVAKSHLPAAEIARIDPMLVLPRMSTTKLTWGWGAEPSPSLAPAP
jgi:murein DD-endopeptidase MepM/ murein hydrolase activator NlpD